MGDYSRSQFWDELDEAPEENWKQEYMENAIRRYLSRPDSPHPPSSRPLMMIQYISNFFVLCHHTDNLRIIINLISIR